MKLITKRNFTQNFLEKKRKIENMESLFKIFGRLEEKIIFVTNNSKLVGTITDGDLRKNFFSINKFSLKKIMNKKPTYLTEKNYTFAYKKINKKKIRYVPIVDKQKRIKSLLDLWADNNFDNKTEVIILAGGFGKRLKPYTNFVPKPMLRINQNPHLEDLIKQIHDQGFNHITILLHHKHDYIKKKIRQKFRNLEINFVIEDKPLGTAGGLTKVKYRNDGPLIVINSDLITNLDLKNLVYYHHLSNADFTVSVKQKIDKLPFAAINLKKNKVTNIEEKPNRDYFFNAGIYMIKKDILKYLKKNKYFDMPTLISNSIKKGKNIVAFNMHEDWEDYGSKETFFRLRKKKR